MDIKLINIEKHFKDLEDPRSREGLHSFRDILLVSLCCGITGQLEWWEMAAFAEAHEDWLKKNLKLEFKSGIPSEYTFQRILSTLEPHKFENCLIKFAESLRGKSEGDIVNLDGKSSRGSTGDTQKMLHSLNAFSSEYGICLGQLATKEKSNEITAIPEMLDMLQLEKSIVTIDAMGCQKAIAQKIVEDCKADYVLALKKNQELLFMQASADLNLGLEKKKKFTNSSFFESKLEIDHGRIEKRRVFSIKVNPNDKEYDSIHFWKGVKSLSVIESEMTNKQTQKKTIERRYYISSLEADAENILRCIRAHWGVENKLHWVLDVAFNEDRSKIRTKNAPRILSVIRKLALNFLKTNPPKYRKKLSYRRMQKLILFNISMLEQVLLNC